jgi:hypothetical protein
VKHPPNYEPPPPSPFSQWITGMLVLSLAGLVTALVIIAGILISTPISATESLTPLRVVEKETVLTIVTSTPTPTATKTNWQKEFEQTAAAQSRWTPTPFVTRTPTNTATPIWLNGDQSGESDTE